MAIPEYNCLLKRRIDSPILCSQENFKTLMFESQLIIIQGNVIQVVDINAKNGSTLDRHYEMDDVITGACLQQQLLWILLKTSKLFLIDLINIVKVKIEFTNASYKIQKIITGNKMHLISESEQQLIISHSADDLVKMMSDTDTLEITLEKRSVHEHPISSENIANGLQYSVNKETGGLVCECPITGFQESIDSAGNKFQSLFVWGDFLILADNANIWIIDVCTSTTILELKSEGTVHYPIATCSNAFYFLSIQDSDVSVKCIQHALDAVNDKGSSDFKGTSSQQSQDFLKEQFRTLVEEYINQVPIPNPTEVVIKLKPFVEPIIDTIFLLKMLRKLCENKIVTKSFAYLMQKKIKSTDDEKIIFEINDFNFKLDILEYIHFKGNNAYDNLNIFEYNHKDLCIEFISNSDFDLASMCWLKYAQIRDPLTAIEVTNILNAIPYNTKMGLLIIWLRNFTLSLLDENPFYIDLFVRWTADRVFKLEKSAIWPKIGLKFIDDIKNVLESSLKTIPIMPISMDELDLLRDQIEYIIELKENYKVNMFLNELSTKTPTEVALIMLHRCYTEDLDNFLKDYIPAFATRHNLDLDEILTAYIENEASSGGGNIEDMRFSLLLNAFRLPNSKLDCLLNVLRVLDVPWSQTVQDVAIKAAAMAENDFTLNDNEKNLAHEIAEELNYANLKVVLKKYNFSLTCTEYYLVLQKVVNAPEVCLQDLKIVMSVMTTDKNYGSILYIARCLRDCDTKDALQYFKSLPLKDSKIILKSLITKYEHIIDSEQNKSQVERCYIDFFKGTSSINQTQLTMIENMYHLKNSHDTRMNLNLMCREETLSTANDDSERNRFMARLMNIRLTQNSAILDLLYRTSSSAQVRQILESLIKSIISSPEVNYDKVYKELSNYIDGNNIPLLMDCWKVLVQLVVDCREEHLNDLTRVLYLLNSLVSTSFVVRNLTVVWKFNYVYLPMSSVSTINDLIMFLSGVTPDDDIGFLSNLCNKNDLPLRVFSDLTEKHILSQQPFDEMLNEFKLKTIKRIISKIVMSQDIDELLLTNLLLVLDSETDDEDRRWIIDLLKGPHETMAPNIIAYLSSPFTRRSLDLSEECSRNAVSYAPQYLLKSKYNMDLAEIAMPDITEETLDVKIILFYVLKQNKDITLDRLIDICRTLNVSINDGISLQLVALLSSWELQYKTYTDELGVRQMSTDDDEHQLLSKCLVLWESLKNRDFLKDILNDLWKNGEVSLHGRLISINRYYYEVYVCIYQLIFCTTNDPAKIKEYFLLNFLKDYKRKSHPQQYEFEQFSAKGMFPEIGYFRLPFHLFMRDDMWANLKSEITLETYELWLPAVALLSLDGDIQTARDMICSNALKQTMKSKKPGEQTETESKETEPWRLSTREEPLLRAAHRCVRHIANMEWAGACLFYVLQGCARGADQVAAAQLCYQFSQRWDALQPGNRAVRKMERLHSTLSTRHVLHKINWASDELVLLTIEPAQLIRTMYLHPKLVEKMSRYDVNRAANEIADKNGINISSIRIQILENILEKNYSNDGNKKNLCLTNKELITAKYILKATCPKMGAIYLSRIAFDDETDFNKSKKLRAIQCLMSIVDSDTAIKVTNKDRHRLWDSILEIFYVINLESIDMPWVVETFVQDKKRAIEQVCAALGTNANGIKLAAELMRRYDKIDAIGNILPLMMRANLHEDAIPLLLRIYYPPDETISAAWRAVLLRPFECADYPITDRQKVNCLKAINLLPFCPAINDEDLKEIWKHCVRCKSYGIACLMLPYMMPETRNSLAELRRIDRRNLIASLKNLQTETFLVSGAMSVLESMTSKGYR